MSSFVYCGLIMSIFFFNQSLAISEEMEEMAKMLHDSCVSETGVDEELIVKSRRGDFTEDDKLKCYMKCLVEQVSALNDDGEIDVDLVISMLPEELVDHVEQTMRACGTVKGTDVCDSMFQTHKCYQSKNPEFYFLI